jgi:hypothetical protein
MSSGPGLGHLLRKLSVSSASFTLFGTEILEILPFELLSIQSEFL